MSKKEITRAYDTVMEDPLVPCCKVDNLGQVTLRGDKNESQR